MAHNYHSCLSVILQSFKSNQGMNEPIYGFVQIGNHVARHCLFFPLAFVIGDGLSGDQLCRRYKNYSPCVSRLSCTCDVSFDHSDNPKWRCNYLKMDDLQKLAIRGLELNGFIPNDDVERMAIHVKQAENNKVLEHLQKKSHHMHDNAFEGMWFGDNSYGILGALPTNLMHAFLHGIIPYVVKTIVAPLTPTEKTSLDNLVDSVLVPIRQGE